MKLALGMLAILLALSQSVLATGQKLEKVYVGNDGLAHIVTSTGQDTAIPKQSDQEAVASPQMSKDQHTAGWLIEQSNCCTSYPIPTRILIYKDGKSMVIQSGMMIYSWCFVEGRNRIAASIGTVHGMETTIFDLYDTGSGKLLKEWSGGENDKSPVWAGCLERQTP